MKLQKSCQGLRDYLGSWNEPGTPLEYNPDVTPIVDLAAFLAPVEWAYSDQTVTVVGVPYGIVVPDDEIWHVWHITAHTQGILPVGTSITYDLTINAQANNLISVSPYSDVIAATLPGGAGATLHRLPCRPGSIIGFSARQFTGAPAMRTAVAYQKIKI